MDKQKPGEWSIQTLWNELLTEERQQEPRDYIRGSELGRSFLERYLKMKGVQYTNPFDARTLRIFDCGNIFEQEVIERMFRLLGLLVRTQGEVVNEVPGMLRTVGHHDPRVGGIIDEKAAREAIAQESRWMQLRATALLNKLLKEYPHGLKELITEIKTVNSRSFWFHKNQDAETGFFKGYQHHKLQLYNYLRATGHPDGRLFYISKDDLTLFETPVLLSDKQLEEEWMEDIHGMTRFWEKGIEMTKKGQGFPILKDGKMVLPDWLQEHVPENMVFNEDKNKWEMNWEVGRSNYLTLWTGYENKVVWENAMFKELRKKNKGKCKDCKKEFSLTTLNKYDGFCGRCHKKGKNDRKS